MKLLIRRKQKQEPSGGTVFTLTCKLQLTEEERALAQRYGGIDLARMSSLDNTTNSVFGVPPRFPAIMDEISMTEFDVQKVRQMEQEIIAACKRTAEYWQLAQSYHGNEEIEF